MKVPGLFILFLAAQIRLQETQIIKVSVDVNRHCRFLENLVIERKFTPQLNPELTEYFHNLSEEEFKALRRLGDSLVTSYNCVSVFTVGRVEVETSAGSKPIDLELANFPIHFSLATPVWNLNEQENSLAAAREADPDFKAQGDLLSGLKDCYKPFSEELKVGPKPLLSAACYQKYIAGLGDSLVLELKGADKSQSFFGFRDGAASLDYMRYELECPQADTDNGIIKCQMILKSAENKPIVAQLLENKNRVRPTFTESIQVMREEIKWPGTVYKFKNQSRSLKLVRRHNPFLRGHVVLEFLAGAKPQGLI